MIDPIHSAPRNPENFADNYAKRRCPFEITANCLGPQCWAFSMQESYYTTEDHKFDTEQERDEFIAENRDAEWHKGTVKSTSYGKRIWWFWREKITTTKYSAYRYGTEAHCERMRHA
jgi:hypothetical protein